MKDKAAVEMTVTELVRRLNHLPAELHKAKAIVSEEGEVVSITIPQHIFTTAELSLLLPECGIWNERKAEG